MDRNLLLVCRMVACREETGDGNAWSYYLVNDCDFKLDRVALEAVSSEWGDQSYTEPDPDPVTILSTGFVAGDNMLLWRDDGEFRMEFRVRVGVANEEAHLNFEFPRVYRLGELPLVAGIGKRGHAVMARACITLRGTVSQLQSQLLGKLRIALRLAKVEYFVYCTEWEGFLPYPMVHWIDVAGTNIAHDLPRDWASSDLEALEAAGYLKKAKEWINPDDSYDRAITYAIT